MQQVIIDISPAGTVKIETNGFKGKACQKATEQIEIVLGGHGAKKSKKKPEFFQQGGIGQQIKRTF